MPEAHSRPSHSIVNGETKGVPDEEFRAAHDREAKRLATIMKHWRSNPDAAANYAAKRQTETDRRKGLLADKIEKRKNAKAGIGADGEPAQPLVDLGAAYFAGGPDMWRAAMEHNARLYKTQAQRNESKADRQSKEKMFATDQDRRTAEANAERQRAQMQFDMQMAALKSDRDAVAQRHAEAMQKGDFAEAQRAREHALTRCPAAPTRRSEARQRTSRCGSWNSRIAAGCGRTRLAP